MHAQNFFYLWGAMRIAPCTVRVKWNSSPRENWNKFDPISISPISVLVKISLNLRENDIFHYVLWRLVLYFRIRIFFKNICLFRIYPENGKFKKSPTFPSVKLFNGTVRFSHEPDLISNETGNEIKGSFQNCESALSLFSFLCLGLELCSILPANIHF